MLLPLGVVGQGVLGGLTVLYGLAPGWVMAHFLLSMAILVAAGDARLAGAAGLRPDGPPAADLATTRARVGAARPRRADAVRRHGRHGRGPARRRLGHGDVVHRLDLEGDDTLGWLIDRHSAIAGLLGVFAVLAWWLARRARRRPRAAGRA